MILKSSYHEIDLINWNFMIISSEIHMLGFLILWSGPPNKCIPPFAFLISLAVLEKTKSDFTDATRNTLPYNMLDWSLSWPISIIIIPTLLILNFLLPWWLKFPHDWNECLVLGPLLSEGNAHVKAEALSNIWWALFFSFLVVILYVNI